MTEPGANIGGCQRLVHQLLSRTIHREYRAVFVPMGAQRPVPVSLASIARSTSIHEQVGIAPIASEAARPPSSGPPIAAR
jgi:hypothetical protein